MLSAYMHGCMMIGWEKFDANRQMLEANFHIEFSMGDKTGSVVRIMPLEELEG